jgi:hypothetical protein
VETGEKRTFAGAIDWPGWCRSGRDEPAALRALLDYGPRYEAALRGSGLGFWAPEEPTLLRVVERLQGSTTTDFGAPAAAPQRDGDKVLDADLQRLEAILKACWIQFDRAVEAARDMRLQAGPRGGGRDLAEIVEHVVGADEAYLSRLGWSYKGTLGIDAEKEFPRIREAMLAGLGAAAKGELPAKGPRGGKRWSTRYFVRRAAWHVLDHAWEIEDRIVG